MNTDVQTAASHNKSEIVIYQPDEVTKIEVLLNNDNIWLNRHQLAALFDRDVKTIGKHINNALTEELYGIPTVAKFATVQKEGNRLVNRDVDYYNLDMILSIGYRVKSPKGVMFRIWANSILKDYMLRGYSVNNRMVALEKRIDKQLIDYKKRLDEHENKIDFFIRTSLPPKQGIFYDGQIFDAYAFAADLIRAARKSVILIDNYVDDTVLKMLTKRETGVTATIYTQKVSEQLKQDLEKHNQQYPSIEVITFGKSHDRFLLIDEAVYHIGASLKDLGRRWFAFSLLRDISAAEVLARLNNIKIQQKL